ncbi:MAG: hypothetical protein GC178_17955 [Flavobacteriales bacterium]|nr:hypothetical protein [Flavobacteriales bacterium]
MATPDKSDNQELRKSVLKRSVVLFGLYMTFGLLFGFASGLFLGLVFIATGIYVILHFGDSTNVIGGCLAILFGLAVVSYRLKLIVDYEKEKRKTVPNTRN